MWTVIIGVALGFLEMSLLKKNVAMMSASKSNIPLGICITVAKLALVLVVLYSIARYISLSAMLWCAGGLAVTMVALPIFQGVAAIRAGSRGNGGEK